MGAFSGPCICSCFCSETGARRRGSRLGGSGRCNAGSGRMAHASLARLLPQGLNGRDAAKSGQLLLGSLGNVQGLLPGAGHQFGVAAAVFVLGVGLLVVLPPFLIQGQTFLLEVWHVLAAFNHGVHGHQAHDGLVGAGIACCRAAASWCGSAFARLPGRRRRRSWRARRSHLALPGAGGTRLLLIAHFASGIRAFVDGPGPAGGKAGQRQQQKGRGFHNAFIYRVIGTREVKARNRNGRKEQAAGRNRKPSAGLAVCLAAHPALAAPRKAAQRLKAAACPTLSIFSTLAAPRLQTSRP